MMADLTIFLDLLCFAFALLLGLATLPTRATRNAIFQLVFRRNLEKTMSKGTRVELHVYCSELLSSCLRITGILALVILATMLVNQHILISNIVFLGKDLGLSLSGLPLILAGLAMALGIHVFLISSYWRSLGTFPPDPRMPYHFFNDTDPIARLCSKLVIPWSPIALLALLWFKTSFMALDAGTITFAASLLLILNISSYFIKPAHLLKFNSRAKKLFLALMVSSSIAVALVRITSPFRSDLDRVNLSGRDLRLFNLASAKLTNAHLSGADLRGLDLSQANLQYSDLSFANLSGAILPRENARTKHPLMAAGLLDTKLLGSDLRGVNLKMTIGLTLAQIGEAITNESTTLSNHLLIIRDNLSLQGLDLSNADLWGANFSGLNLNGTNLSNAKLNFANLSGTTLVGADLSAADCTQANLSNANLTNASLIYATFSNANLENSSLMNASLYGTDFDQANLRNSNLDNASISSAKFTRASLTSSSFSMSKIVETQFNGSDLKDASFIGTTLESCNFSYARNFSNEQMKQAVHMKDCTLPTGIKQIAR